MVVCFILVFRLFDGEEVRKFQCYSSTESWRRTRLVVSFGEIEDIKKREKRGGGGLNGELITEESSRLVSAVAVTTTTASPSRLRPGRIKMGAGVDIQSQVHGLGGAVSELSLGETVRRIRILLDRLQMETGAGSTIRQVNG